MFAARDRADAIRVTDQGIEVSSSALGLSDRRRRTKCSEKPFIRSHGERGMLSRQDEPVKVFMDRARLASGDGVPTTIIWQLARGAAPAARRSPQDAARRPGCR